MSEKDVVITYETLFEMLRIEKNREDLQKLDDSFFEDVLSYLKDKQASFESAHSEANLFVTDEKEQTRLELENIKKILKDLYDKREKKVLSTAVNKARTGVVLMNTASMLPSERLLFESLSLILADFRKNVLFKLASGELPEIGTLSRNISKLDIDVEKILKQEPEQSQSSISTDSQDAGFNTGDKDLAQGTYESNPDDLYESGMNIKDIHALGPSDSSKQPKELKTPPNFSDSSAYSKKVRFLASIGEIVGPDLQIYGPYEEGAVISLPDELARVLLEKKQAEEING
ncbi:MAG: hypothetical protein V1729_04335 [Candidatus Woesearchaeota archaeon]